MAQGIACTLVVFAMPFLSNNELNVVAGPIEQPKIIVKILKYTFLLLVICASCKKKELVLNPVSYAQFEQFVKETDYVTDAEKYGWSIVQTDVYNFITVDNANWRKPDGIHKVDSKKLPVTQVSYNDAVAYCKWAKKRLPTYDEYWEVVNTDNRIIVTENRQPISEIENVNIIGNVWDITTDEKDDFIRLAGGSLFCFENNCHGTTKERELFVDKETGNIHIGFSVLDL